MTTQCRAQRWKHLTPSSAWPVPLWPRLPLALGYTGGARWVAFYIALDRVTYNDGASSGTGDTRLFLAFKRHPVVAPHLVGADLGSPDTEASEWLVVDRQDQVLYQGISPPTKTCN